MHLRRILAITTITGSAFVSSCVSVETTQPGAIGLDRTQRVSLLVPPEQLEEGAALAYAQELAKARQGGDLNTNPAMTRRVRAIADRVIPAVAVFRKDALDWNWQVNVIDSDQINAWAMPGGRIAFYSGIIEKLDLTDAEIAAIMGHEIAHALREHAWERVSEQTNKSALIGLIGAVTGAGQTAQSLVDLAFQAAVGLPNSRTHETEADRVGVELMARAGYDPRAAISVWQKMNRVAGGNRGPAFLSTHPSSESRIEDLTDYANRVMPLYQQAARG